MGRKRKYHRTLPEHVTLRSRTYYYRRNGKWFRLGRTLPEMYRALAEFVDTSLLRSTSDVIQRYRLEVLPEKAENTQKTHALYLNRIEAVFGKMLPRDIRPVHIQQYLNARHRQTSAVTANKELEVLKHLLSKACTWGAIDDNPAREVRKLPTTARKRYVTDAEYCAVYALASPMIKVAMDLAILTGLRRGDLLALTRDSLTEEGILVATAKTGKSLLIQWTPILVSVINSAKGLPPHVRRSIIATRHGKVYSSAGFNANWQRLMRRCEKAGVERFQFKDLRAKSASDGDAQAATERLGHTSRQTTEKYYRRAPAKVWPLR